MKSILKSNLEEARGRLVNALDNVPGYEFKLGALTYQPDGNFRVQVDARKNGEKSEEQKYYEANRNLLGLPVWGKTVLIEGYLYEVVGIAKAGATVILKRCTDGVRFHHEYYTFKELLRKDTE